MGEMDTLIIAAIVGGIVTVITSLTGAVVAIINASAAARDRKESANDRETLKETAKSTSEKADVIIEKATEIHTVTNSNLSEVTSSLRVANEKIAGMEKLMASLIKNGGSAAGDAASKRDDMAQEIKENTRLTKEIKEAIAIGAQEVTAPLEKMTETAGEIKEAIVASEEQIKKAIVVSEAEIKGAIAPTEPKKS